jgi:putative membrane protein
VKIGSAVPLGIAALLPLHPVEAEDAPGGVCGTRAVPLLVTGALLLPSCAFSHGSEAAAAKPEAWLVFLLLASAALYAAGIARLWAHAGRSRGISAAKAGAFAAGWLTLAGALIGPIDGLSDRLFSVHMVQHEVLMIVAAPLLVLGRPLAVWTWALAPRHRHWIVQATHWRWVAWPWSRITRPVTAWGLHALALWLWHAPRLFDAALRSEGIHILQHTSFLITALLFWWSVLGGDPRSGRGGFALVSVFTTMMHTSALGALLTFATTAWYAPYVIAGGALGLSPIEDQQLGGLVMWVPGATTYLLFGLVLLARLLKRRAPRKQMRRDCNGDQRPRPRNVADARP